MWQVLRDMQRRLRPFGLEFGATSGAKGLHGTEKGQAITA
jgi:hypothetical protein